MKKSWVAIIVIALIVLIGGCSIKNGYNNLVNNDEDVKNAWGQVENQYQRRADLIPNLVKTVQGAADFEKSTLTEVIEARASATQIKVDPEDLTPEAIEKFQAAQGQLSQALGRLLAVAENYPTLTATQNFQDLQKQLEGTENRITVARQDFNNQVNVYNKAIRKFPTVLYAGMFGFDKKGFFEADKGAEKAPEVNFGSSK